MARLLTVLVVAGLLGCGGHQSDAARALDAYARALERANYGQAYDMMSAGFKAKHTRDEFVRMMKDNPSEVRETTTRLRGPRSVEETAEFSYGAGDRLRLVREAGRWRLAANPIDFYGQGSPRDALRSFIRAYRHRRWDVMLRFVPDKYREKMTVETLRSQFEGSRHDDVEKMMNLLEANVDEPIVDKGDEARMPYGDRFEVKFKREEDGRWMIQDPD